jgi:hypothetical protein
MDVAFLAASACLTSYVRTNVRRVDESQQTYRPVLACLFLSFCLLSLSFVETIMMMSVSLSSSSTWWTIILCPNEESETHSQSRRCVRIETAYQVVLWTQVLLMLVVLPSLIGGQIFATIRDDCFAGQQKLDPDEEKKRSFVSPRQYHWSLRLLYRMVRCVLHSTLQLLHYMILLPIAYVADQFTFSQPFRYRQVKTSLPTTHHQSTFAFHDDARLPETSSSLPSGRIHSLRTGAVLGSILGVLSTFALLRILGPLVIHTSPSAPFLSQAVSWLVAVGILLSSCLNGFGSVSMPHSCLAGWYLEPIHDDTIRQARIELQHTQTSLEDRRAELRGNHSTSSPQVPTGLAVTETRQSLWGNRRGSKVFSNIGDEVTQRRKHITTEIAFLETLVAELNEDVEEMQVSQRLAQEARTPLGRVKSWLGIAFSAVLLLRLASAARYLWIHTHSKEDGDSSGGVDLVTQAVVWWTRRDGATTTKSTDVNAAVYSQVISLALTAVLSISQIRTLLRTVAFLHRRWQVFYRKCYCLEGSRPSVNRSSNRPRTDPGHLNLGGSTVLAHAMGMGIGCYFLACVVLTKLMVPESYRRAFAAALGTTEALAVRTYVTQAAFGVAAGGSCLLLGILLSIQRQNVSRYTRNAALHTPTRKSNHAPSLDGAV